MADTSPPLPSPGLIRTAIDQARQTALQIDNLRAANARTIRTLETALKAVCIHSESQARFKIMFLRVFYPKTGSHFSENALISP